MTPVTELDIAPLTWVRSEIDAALGRALEAIGQAEQGEAGNDQLRFAQNHVHQVQGALSMVGLDGVTQYAEAVDGLLVELAGGKLAFGEQHASLLRRALIALGNYLAELEDGAPHQPLRLYPLLSEIAAARGVEAPSEGELFFPDLARRVPQLAAPIAVDAERAAKELRLLRGRFEKGLLAWLRQPASDAGPREMLFAVSRIAQLNAAPSTRSFWWSAIAFFEGLVQGAIASDRGAQRLCRRIDTQMKRLLDGSQVVAERLVRDVLFHVASAHIESGHAKAVREAFQLDRLIPSAEASRVAETPLAPIQRSLREALENAKEAWNRFAAGAAVGLPQMQEQLAAARKPLETLQLPQIESLVRALDSTAGWLRKDPLKSNEDLSMDVATALLLAERAVDAPAGSDAQLREQVAAVCHRLLQRVSGRDPGPLDEALFGEASRHVQEKLFFNQLAREIQTTLGQVEQTLDGFFRDPSGRDSLAALAAPLKQVEGAFAMLGEQRAVSLVRENGERIAALAQAEAPDSEEFERVAHELSALGFFVEALRHGPANLERFLAPHGGAVAQEEAAPVTVEAEVRQQSRELQQQVQALASAPADEKLRAELKQNLETLREDAALLADSKLEQQAREALAALKSGGDSAAVKEAVASIAPAPTVAAPSADAARLIEASEEQIDAELLEIFLEEAHEVLDTIRTHREAAEREPHNQENVVTIRRGFHTLKGSSRMVGLIDFSDAGKAVEFAMNRWLQLERDAAPEMLSLVGNAHTVMSEWVVQLESGGGLWKDASALIAQADALLNANDPLAAAAPAPSPAPAVAAPVAAPATTSFELSDEQGPVDLDLDAAGEFDLNSTMISPDGPSGAAPEPETIDLTSTLLAPFNLGDEPEEVPESDLLAPFDEVEIVPPAQAPAPADETVDLTASLIGIAEDSDEDAQAQLVVTALEPVQPDAEEDVVQVPADTPQTLDFSLEELSLTDEEALPGGRPVEEELDLTATLLAPLEMRDAIYGYEEPAPVEPEAPIAASLPELVAPAPAPEPVFEPAPEPVIEVPVEAPVLEAQAPEVFESEEAFVEPPEAEEDLAALAALDRADETDVVATEDGEIDLTETDLEPVMVVEPQEDLPTLSVEEIGTAEAAVEAEPAVEVPAPSLDVPLEERTDAEGQVLKAFEATDLGFGDDAMALEAEHIAEPEPEPEPDVVMLGDTAVSRPLYDLYVAEARQHVGTLRDELPRFVANPMLVPQEPVIRAAHTLGGISGTARVTSVRVLAKALEHVLAKLHLASLPPTTDQAELIRACGERLDAMVAEIIDGQMPLEVPELVGALENLQPYTPMAEPVVVEEAPAALFDEADAGELSVPELEEIQVDAAPVAEDVAAEAVVEEPAPEADFSIESQLETAPSEPLPAYEPVAPAQQALIDEAPRAVLRDELDDQLMPIFYEEAEELTRDLSASIRDLREGSDAQEAANAVARLLHTLKGSARMAGAMTLGEHVHGMENRLLAARDSGHATAMADDLDAGLDQVGLMIGRMQAGLPAFDAAPQVAAADTGEGEAPAAGVAAAPAAPVAAAVAFAAAEGDAQTGPTATLRVRAQLVDRFVNEAGEIAIARTRIEGELRTLRRSMLDLTENVIRLRNQLREVEIAAETQMQARVALAETQHAEFDPLEFDRFTRFQELTRMMAESVGDVTTIQQNLLKNLDAADTALHAQGRLSRDLQQALMGVRMVPFDEIADRLYRVVRQTAKELGKRANLDIRGGQIEIDRSVLDKMTAPIEHLLRNAIAHGLEMPEQRRAAGKDEIGQITLTVTQRSNEIAIELADDGRGLDFDAIRRRGESRGLLPAGEEPSETRLTQLIFEPGFSTAEQVSEVAGRGVGMDVVKSETIGVGGRIEVASEIGRGARFLVHLPLTLAVTQALLVRAGERTFAIPSNMVEQVLELKQEALDAMRAAGEAEWKERKYPMRYLPRILGDAKSQPAAGRFHWVLLLRSGTDAIALHVDELRGNQEIVVKNAGPQFTRLQGFSGATVLADGEISLILNPVVLSQVVGALAVQAAAGTAPVVQTVAPVAYVPTVMVTDDSLTVRKITTRLLEREGYRVVTAKDGVDALEQLVDTLPDVMLLDIEMPRMDGFDLTRNIRADERLRGLPIIMITSRMADKHRNYAKEIGVNHYLGKPYNEEELLSLIEELTKR